MQLSFFGLAIYYYTLWSIRDPELWLERNSEAKNSKTRFETRLKLKAQLEKTCFRFCCNDQILFAVVTDSEVTLLQGEIIDTLTLNIEGVTLHADLEKNRVICKNLEGQQWQTEMGWSRIKQRGPKKKVQPDIFSNIKTTHTVQLLEIEQDLNFIRARKRELELV